MTDPSPEKRPFCYDDDPQIRAMEQRLERPAMLAHAARAQRRVRRRMFFQKMAFAGLLLATAFGVWRMAVFFFNPKSGKPPEAEKSIALRQPTGPLEEKPLPESRLPAHPEPPTSPPPTPDPPIAAIIDFQPEGFSADLRPAAEAIRNGRLSQAAQHLAMLEKKWSETDDLRSLDEEGEAQLDSLTFLKGLVFLKKQEFSEAVGQFSKLDADGKPWRDEARLYLFEGYFLMKKKKEAEAVLEKMRRDGSRFLRFAEGWRLGG